MGFSKFGISQLPRGPYFQGIPVSFGEGKYFTKLDIPERKGFPGTKMDGL